jgi:hypothetical protein
MGRNIMFDSRDRVMGTEGTENYVIVSTSDIGLVAVRHVHGCTYRIRVQPATATGAALIAEALQPDSGWKQPGEGGQNRFSVVVASLSQLRDMVTKAVEAIDALPNTGSNHTGDSSRPRCDFEGFLAAIVMAGTTDRRELIGRVRASNLPGREQADSWPTTLLLGLLSAHKPDDEHTALVAWVRKQKLPGFNLASRWSTTVLRRKVLDS